MPNCTRCGTGVADHAHFCSHCGKALDASSASSTATDPPVNSVADSGPRLAPSDDPASRPRFSTKDSDARTAAFEELASDPTARYVCLQCLATYTAKVARPECRDCGGELLDRLGNAPPHSREPTLESDAASIDANSSAEPVSGKWLALLIVGIAAVATVAESANLFANGDPINGFSYALVVVVQLAFIADIAFNFDEFTIGGQVGSVVGALVLPFIIVIVLGTIILIALAVLLVFGLLVTWLLS